MVARVGIVIVWPVAIVTSLSGCDGQGRLGARTPCRPACYPVWGRNWEWSVKAVDVASHLMRVAAHGGHQSQLIQDGTGLGRCLRMLLQVRHHRRDRVCRVAASEIFVRALLAPGEMFFSGRAVSLLFCRLPLFRISPESWDRNL